MPFVIERNELASVAVDAVVVSADERLQILGDVALSVARAAGLEELQAACDEIGFCPVGSAVATPGFAIPAKTVVHAVAPAWRGGGHGEPELLYSAYEAAFECAFTNGARSIATPLIHTESYGFPAKVGLSLAREAIKAFLNRHDDVELRLVLHDNGPFAAGIESIPEIVAYIDARYGDDGPAWKAASPNVPFVQGELRSSAESSTFGDSAQKSHDRKSISQRVRKTIGGLRKKEDTSKTQEVLEDSAASMPSAAPEVEVERLQQTTQAGTSAGLDDLLASLDASFSTTLLTLIDERGMTDAQVYKRANMSRQLFSKIRSDSAYRPTKKTALALAIALELDLDKTNDLLGRAGFTLSHSNKADVIVEYFIERKNYDIFEINEALYAFDQPLL